MCFMKEAFIPVIINKKTTLAIFTGCLLFLSLEAFFMASRPTEDTEQTVAASKVTTEKIIKDSVQLDVPLLDQMTEPSLYNGCEVTSLAMLLNYCGLPVTKNELAEAIPKQPLYDAEGLYGNPHAGFVGDITGVQPGYFVYAEPVFELAQTYETDQLEFVNLTGENFSELAYYLSSGSPIWVIITVTYQETNDMTLWETADGDVAVSMNEHSAVITGYDDSFVYLNDPYGQEVKADKDDFIASWKQFGSQAIAVNQKDKSQEK